LKKFPAILPLSLSTPLAQKTRMTHTHTTIPCKHYGKKMRRKPCPASSSHHPPYPAP
jgi:hypothetical protein